MDMQGVSLVGWLHSLACTIAILTGAWNILGPKGTTTHRLVGRTYFYTMLFATLSTFAIYHFDIAHFVPFTAGPGTFGLFHWEAVFTLFFLLLGVYAAPRQRRAAWAYAHPLSMLTTYYMLMGGLVNELFVRVTFLRTFAASFSQSGLAGSPVVGAVQSIVMLIYFGALIYFGVQVALYRRRATHAIA